MAIPTKISRSVLSQGKFVGAAHELMAGDAGDVPFGPGINRFFPDGMSDGSLPAMTIGTLGYFVTVKHQPVVRSVGLMTFTAFTFIHQRMSVHVFFAADKVLSILVAIQTNFSFLSFSQGSLIRGVRTVAIDAEHPAADMAVYLHEAFLSIPVTR